MWFHPTDDSSAFSAILALQLFMRQRIALHAPLIRAKDCWAVWTLHFSSYLFPFSTTGFGPPFTTADDFPNHPILSASLKSHSSRSSNAKGGGHDMRLQSYPSYFPWPTTPLSSSSDIMRALTTSVRVRRRIEMLHSRPFLGPHRVAALRQ